VLGFVYGTERAGREIAQLLREIYPSATAQEVRIARELVDGRAVSLGIGIVGTLIGAAAVHGSIDAALAAVLRAGKRRSLVRQNVAALAFIAAIAGLAVVSFGLSYFAQAAQGALASAGYGPGARALIAIGAPLLGFAAGYAFFYTIYRFVPRAPVPRSTARRAALVAAVLWEVAKVAFAFFTRALGTFTAYGPLAFAAGLLTWVYLTAVIILVGAEVLKARTTS
jgi:membrane protein